MQMAGDQPADLPHMYERHARQASEVVSYIDLQDETIAPGLRQQISDPRTLQEEFAKFVARDRRSVVHALLNEVANSLEDITSRAKYQDFKLSDKEMIEVLRYASSERRLEFVRTLYALAKDDKLSTHFIERRLDNVMHFLSVAERVRLLNEWLPNGHQSDTEIFMAAVCRASKDYDELRAVVNQVGQKELFNGSGSEVKEYVAQVVLGSKLRALKFPYAPDGFKDTGALYNAFHQTIATLELAERICEIHPLLAPTQAAKDFAQAARFNLYYLKVGSAHASSVKEMKELVNLIAYKAPIEFKYGLCFTYDEGSRGQKWSIDELTKIKTGLESIPEGKILFTPNLMEIRRVVKLNGLPDSVALRDWDGAIKVPDCKDVNLSFTIVHEIGHGIHLGHWWENLKEYLKSGPLLTGEPAYEIGEYWKLSGWKIIEKDRYEMRTEKVIQEGKKHKVEMVVLDGEKYELNKPITHLGQNIVLTTQYGYLLSYAASAKFTVASYAHSSPWEDFAETFADYCIYPSTLIDKAPQKFWHLEQEFRKYEDRPDLLLQLEQALSR